MAQPHDVLGVAANADEATINAAFRREAKKFHPDLNNGDLSGAMRLRRLIAARDYLTKRRLRPASSEARYLLPPLRKKRITRSVFLTFALTCAFAFLLLPVRSPEAGDNLQRMSVIAKTSAAQAVSVKASTVQEASIAGEADVPDAGSAEIKAIRDLQEAVSYGGTGTEPAEPLLQRGAKRQPDSPASHIRKAVKGAAALVSKTLKRIAPKL